MAAVKPKRTTSKKLKASKNKKINKWLILGGIAAVAVIGVVVVRFSSASRYSFVRNAYQNQIGRIDVYGNKESTGTFRYADRIYAATSSSTTRGYYKFFSIASGSELANSRQICAYAYNGSKSNHYMYIKQGGNVNSKYVLKGQRVNVCKNATRRNGDVIEFWIDYKDGVNANNNMGVSSIYGLR